MAGDARRESVTEGADVSSDDAGTSGDARSGADTGEGDTGDAGTDGGDAHDDQPWREVFGHAAPYDDQVDGIETAIGTAESGGFLALEGACGTGKTHIALTAGIHLVRDPDTEYERVLCLTSVKQQLRQFEEDLRIINANLPADWHPVSGLTLVGKADVCAYNVAGTGGIDDGNVYERCEGLRERTRALADDTSAGDLASRARSRQIGLADSGTGGDAADYLEAAGGMAPYPEGTPEDGDVEYCPFYAQFLDDLPDDGEASEAVPFDWTETGHIDAQELTRLSVDAGTCPHSVMGALLPEVEVVVGNYYHAFDPTTVETFTGALLDESTFVVCDEAHMLEPRVRDLVSDGIADKSLRDAESELAQVVQPLTMTEETGRETGPVDEIRAELDDARIDLDDLQRTRQFMRDLREELGRRVEAHLDREHRGWRANLNDLPDGEIPLRDPEQPRADDLTQWAEEAGYGERDWVRAESACAVAARILNTVEEDGGARGAPSESSGEQGEPRDKKRAAPAVGRAMGAWCRADHVDHFREIELERTWDDAQPTDAWRRAYNARFALHNCLPGDAIAEQLGEFGGGVLMSATLEPLDVFAEVTGLDHLKREADRPVVTRSYGLDFPAENRESFAVAAPPFTFENRGTPGEATEARRIHAGALREVAGVSGNVLVGMPNYAEAEWAAGHLRDAIDKEVLLDESSTDDVTEDLKQAFFDGPGKVLVTSLRGTLTEGIDYRGDRLHAAVVCGVPLINTASPRTRALRTAYDRRFGDGFEYALTVPAVRKARQAVGRVIRGPDETGVRVLLDERYARDTWNSVREYLGPDREEFQPVSPDMLSLGLERFRGAADGPD
jgi:DNA excision repair protein ERCC-2